MDKPEDLGTTRLEEGEAWRARLAAGAAQSVRRRRLDRGISVQKLADICTNDYGLPIKRSVLANFEGGRRPALSVAELLVLAKILELSPLELLFPVGMDTETEILPGVAADTWEAAKWFTGEQAGVPGQEPAEPAEPHAVQLFREYDRLVAGWREQKKAVFTLVHTQATGGGAADVAFFESLAKAVAELESSITVQRQRIRTRGLKPPRLLPELEHLEAGDTRASRQLDALSPRTNGEK
ncbi:helix-turn-helix domain-containing protein [Streptomyces sp. NPDC058653]|uniref:helix-turn-helix domain-containing protein n=1 Tax=Streptomyces sp. NPDC058653 TaxID=3346576 RepID=UPI0036543DB2